MHVHRQLAHVFALAIAAGLSACIVIVDERAACSSPEEILVLEDRDEHAGPHEHEPFSEPPNVEGLGDLNVRLEILREARHAYLEAGDEASALLVLRCIHVGELQLAGAPAEEIAASFEGLSMGPLIESLQGASALWSEWGHETRAGRCNALAEHYAARERQG